MKKYTAAKPCNFGGKKYMIGETIPTEAIDPARAPTLVKYGVIHETEAAEQPKPQATATKKTGKKVE